MHILIVPAYQPDQKLIELLRGLSGQWDGPIIVVNDGSDTAKNPIFREAESLGATVLRHAVNLGKGQALKTAFNHVIVEYPDADGVVTADADGQHSPEDIARICEELKSNPDSLIMGGRQFEGEIPLRSKVGNVLTRAVLRFATGIALMDTQTGLRGISIRFIPALLNIKASRYEFETEMLISARQNNIVIQEMPIETIYIDENESSHFNMFFDSLRIYFSLLRFTIASILTVMIDYALFYFIFNLSDSILTAHILARILALTINFLLVRNFVFLSREEGYRQLPRYLLWVLILGSLSYLGISSGVSMFGVHPMAAKVSVEAGLFILNFLIQRDFVFAKRQRD